MILSPVHDFQVTMIAEPSRSIGREDSVVARGLSLSSMVASHGPRTARGLVRLSSRFTKLSLWRPNNDRRGFRLLLFLRRYDSLSCLVDADAAPRPERKVRKDGSSPRYREVASSLE